MTVAADGSNLNPVALALLQMKLPDGTYVIPSPQITGAGVNYTNSDAARFSEDQGIANLDHQFTEANRLTFKLMIAAEPTCKPFGSANVPGFGSTQVFKKQSPAATPISSASLVNEARIGVSRTLGTAIRRPRSPSSHRHVALQFRRSILTCR